MLILLPINPLDYFFIFWIFIKTRVLLPINHFLVFDFWTRVLLPINSFLFLIFGIFMGIRVLLPVNSFLFFFLFFKTKIKILHEIWHQFHALNREFCYRQIEMIVTKSRLLLQVNRDDCDKTPTFATGKSRWLFQIFFYTYLRIATSGLRQQSGRKINPTWFPVFFLSNLQRVTQVDALICMLSF